MMRRALVLPFFCVTGSICYTAYANKPSTPLSSHYLKTGLYSPLTEDESLWLKLARTLAIFSTTLVSRFFLEVLNDFHVDGNLSNYHRLLEEIHRGKSKRKQALLTVSNHTSVFDDPVLQSSLVGFLSPDQHRWGVCKEHICFPNAMVASFTGAGKVFPIRVGDGVDQPRFKAVGRRLKENEWVHLYPEAGCNQTRVLGCERDETKKQNIGVLKWGVGKLVAKMDTEPLIIPYYHVGMDKVKPQKKENKELVDPWYVLGRCQNSIRVLVGPPVEVSDLFIKARERHAASHVNAKGEFVNWDESSEEERELYSQITKRVEDALARLEQEAKEKYGVNFELL